MTDLKQIKKTIKSKLPELQKKYSIISFGLFGSYLHGEQDSGSDIDILVEFSEAISLFKFVDLELELSDILGVKVDLVIKDSLKPFIGKRILEEVEYL